MIARTIREYPTESESRAIERGGTHTYDVGQKQEYVLFFSNALIELHDHLTRSSSSTRYRMPIRLFDVRHGRHGSTARPQCVLERRKKSFGQCWSVRSSHGQQVISSVLHRFLILSAGDSPNRTSCDSLLRSEENLITSSRKIVWICGQRLGLL